MPGTKREAFKDLKALDALFDNDLVYVDFDGRADDEGIVPGTCEVCTFGAGRHRINDCSNIQHDRNRE